MNYPAFDVPADVSLVVLTDGEPRTTTLVIADGTENEHASVIALVRNYINDFQEFGNVDFKSTLNPGQKRATEYASLNEGQSTFLLTLMRNSEIVVAFKKRLVKAFLLLKSQHLPVAPVPPEMQIAQAMLLAGKMIEEQKLQIEQRDKLIAEVAPKAAALDHITQSDGSVCLQTGVKVLGFLKIKDGFQWLHEIKCIFRRGGDWIAHQDKLRAGLLEEKTNTFDKSDGTKGTSYQALLTPAGITYLATKIKKNPPRFPLIQEVA